MEAVETKVCTRCGKELPLSMFHIDSRMKGGLKNQCKECKAMEAKERIKEKKEAKEASPLSAFTPRELLSELSRRGYKGEVYYTYKVTL